MKKKLVMISAVLLMIAYILIPYPTSDLHVKINFSDVSGTSCTLYYATVESGGFVGEQMITSNIINNQADFKLDASVIAHLTQLRFDWPNEEQMLCIDNVTVSSAGVNKKCFSKERFFTSDTIQETNDIQGIFNEYNGTYISTDATDPYCVMTPEFSSQIQKLNSHYRLSKALFCLLIMCAYFSWKSNLFSDNTNHSSEQS